MYVCDICGVKGTAFSSLVTMSMVDMYASLWSCHGDILTIDYKRLLEYTIDTVLNGRTGSNEICCISLIAIA